MINVIKRYDLAVSVSHRFDFKSWIQIMRPWKSGFAFHNLICLNNKLVTKNNEIQHDSSSIRGSRILILSSSKTPTSDDSQMSGSQSGIILFQRGHLEYLEILLIVMTGVGRMNSLLALSG